MLLNSNVEVIKTLVSILVGTHSQIIKSHIFYKYWIKNIQHPTK